MSLRDLALASFALPAASGLAPLAAGLSVLPGLAFLSPFPPFASAIDQISGTLGDTHLPAVVENFETDTRRLIRFGIDNRQVRQMDRRFLADDPAFGLGRLARVATHEVDAGDNRAAVVGHHVAHLASLALVTTSRDDHPIALSDLSGH